MFIETIPRKILPAEDASSTYCKNGDDDKHAFINQAAILKIQEIHCVCPIRLIGRLLEQVTNSTKHGVENEDQEAKRSTQDRK